MGRPLWLFAVKSPRYISSSLQLRSCNQFGMHSIQQISSTMRQLTADLKLTRDFICCALSIYHGIFYISLSLQWYHNEQDGVSNHRRLECLLNRLFRHRSKRISKLRVTGLCEGNSPVTGEPLTQRTSDAEFFSIWWRHRVLTPGDSEKTSS